MRTDSQYLDDEEITLVIDQAKYFQFQIDDIEKKHAHINWEDMAADRAAYRLRDSYDSAILSYFYTQLAIDGTADNFYGTESTPIKIGYTSTQVRPLNAIARLLRKLDERNVPEEGRYIVVDPAMAEQLQQEDSKLLSQDYVEKGTLTNGKLPMRIRGFQVYQSNNLPIFGTGPDATTSNNGGIVIAGHKSAVATAEQIKKTEKFRSQDTFADVTRGLHLYGRKLLRPEALQIMRWNVAT